MLEAKFYLTNWKVNLIFFSIVPERVLSKEQMFVFFWFFFLIILYFVENS